MTELRQAQRRSSDCPQNCPYADSIEAIQKEIHSLREFVEKKMDDVPDRLMRLEIVQGQQRSQINDCDADRSDIVSRLHATETNLEVLEEKLKPLGEARLWVIALGAMMIANLVQGMLK